MWSEIKRKLFHLIGLVYVVGLVMVPRKSYLVILTIAVAVIFLLEQARLRVAVMRSWFSKYAGTLFRENERQKMSGVFWMAEGAWITVLLLKSIPLAATSLLYLLFGDAVASLAGKRLQGPRWPGSEKSISGSTACFLMCLFIGATLLRPYYYEWSGIVLGALVATVVEALPLRLNDNVTIPTAAALTFLLCFGG